MRVTNGMLARSVASRMRGDSASRKGLDIRRYVDRVRILDVVCIERGRWTSRLAVMRDRTRRNSEKSRRLQKILVHSNEDK
jgi:hypothetical protein